jgi:hypothetical protein
MKQRSQHVFSEVGENLEYFRDNLRGLSESITELETLLEDYRASLMTDDRVDYISVRRFVLVGL